MNILNMEAPKLSVKFAIKKKVESKVDEKLVLINHEANKEKEEKEIGGKVFINKNKERVVPMIEVNRWRMNDKNDEDKTEEEQLEEEAARALIEEGKDFSEGVRAKENDKKKLNYTIPMLDRNRVPEGLEEDGKPNLSIRPADPTEETYDGHPIQGFGLAMLRGMGWKKEVGIGRTFKLNVEVKEVEMRPKGLGLGAGSKNPPKLEDIKINCYVIVKEGTYKSKCGVITYVDVDQSRCHIKLATTADDGNTSVNVAQSLVKVVNKPTYQKLVDSSKKNAASEPSKRHKSCSNGHAAADSTSKKRRGESSKSSSRDHKKVKKEVKREDTWLRQNIKVRIVRKGEHYLKKVVVEDVYNMEGDCLLRTDSGKLLDNFNQRHLETVLPKSSEEAYVIITKRGNYRGKYARIMEKNKTKSTAHVQLIEDRDVLLSFHYNEICQFVGNIEDNEMF